MLTGMNQRMDATRGDVAALRGEMAALQKDMAAKEKLQQTKGDMLALMEAYFTPKFNLLAGQIKLTQEKQAPMEALEQAGDRLDVLEAVVKSHSKDIRKAEKSAVTRI